MRVSRTVVALIVGTLSIACTEASTPKDCEVDAGTPTNVPPPAEFSELTICAELSKVICEEVVTCGCPDAIELDTCIKEQRAGCEFSFSGLIGSVALGRLSFDAAAGKACVEGFAAAVDQCSSPGDTPLSGSCGRMFRVNVALGDQCGPRDDGLGCADGQGVCSSSGECQALPGAGLPCNAGSCAGDLICVGDVCVAFTSLPNLPSGSDCSDPIVCAKGLACVAGKCAAATPVGGECRDSIECGRSMMCDIQSARSCRPKALENEPCEGDGCADGLGCDVFLGMPRCKKLAVAGESCAGGVALCAPGTYCDNDKCRALPAKDDVCYFGQCAKGLVCSADQKCVEPVAKGEPCNSSDGCATGLACNLETYPGVCVDRVGEGMPCGGADDRCLAGLFCDPANMNCATFLVEGADCSSTTACGVDAECLFAPGVPAATGKCTPLSTKVGDPCGFTCGGGLRCTMNPGKCVPGLCEAL